MVGATPCERALEPQAREPSPPVALGCARAACEGNLRSRAGFGFLRVLLCCTTCYVPTSVRSSLGQ